MIVPSASFQSDSPRPYPLIDSSSSTAACNSSFRRSS
uniref:Uncharacterized protein n=1 Tax=Myoviridae sp. ctX172 TaxID=2826663 RepID=A0A8S5QSR0_9CAUD|nr:MAG TPA: hypothetical protein [Myoviridae sp. ctX172]DAM31860.1 MAG TPA: hypothetical protein [Caudoviricetes sp.]DAY78191.1 MAG TPA: hypothetical protein [Caudoviricetes sp.]